MNTSLTTIESFATHFRVRIRRDECNDQIIDGRRAHLYFDGPALCLMAIDAIPANRGRWETLGGKLWMGDISLDSRGKRVQDVKVTGITNPQAAIRLAGIKKIRVMSEAQRAVLDKARSLLPVKSPGTLQDELFPSQNRSEGLEPSSTPAAIPKMEN